MGAAPSTAPATTEVVRPHGAHARHRDPRGLAVRCARHPWRSLAATLFVLAGAVVRIGGELTAAYTGVDGVRAVGAPVPAPDGRTMLLPVTLDAASATLHAPPAGERPASEAVGPMRAVTDRLAAAHPELRIGQVGSGSMDAEMSDSLESDFRRAEFISLPVTLGVLLVAFGAVVAAGVPVLLGVAAVVAALGLTALSRAR